MHTPTSPDLNPIIRLFASQDFSFKNSQISEYFTYLQSENFDRESEDDVWYDAMDFSSPHIQSAADLQLLLHHSSSSRSINKRRSSFDGSRTSLHSETTVYMKRDSSESRSRRHDSFIYSKTVPSQRDKVVGKPKLYQKFVSAFSSTGSFGYGIIVCVCHMGVQLYNRMRLGYPNQTDKKPSSNFNLYAALFLMGTVGFWFRKEVFRRLGRFILDENRNKNPI